MKTDKRRPAVLAWCKDNEKELALVILGLFAGLQFGRLAGRREQ